MAITDRLVDYYFGFLYFPDHYWPIAPLVNAPGVRFNDATTEIMATECSISTVMLASTETKEALSMVAETKGF